MDTIMQSQIFFFISSLGFIFLWILASLILFYLLRAIATFSKILEKLEGDIDQLGDTTKEMVEDMKDSFIFNFLFRKRKKRHLSKEKRS